MSYRFYKEVYNDEDGVRTLGFFEHDTGKAYINFDLNVVDDYLLEHGELATARMVCTALQAALGVPLTEAEIEHAVEDI